MSREEHRTTQRVIPVTRAAIYSLIVSFLSSVIVGFVAIQIAVNTDQKSNQRWCGLVTALDDAYSNPDNPPQSELGVRIAGEINRLRSDFRCDN